MFYDIYYVILDIFSLFVARHSKEELGSQEDVGCLLNFFPQDIQQVILDIFYMIFFFFIARRHSKEEQGSQKDVGCLLNFFPHDIQHVILDIFKMIFFFFVARWHSSYYDVILNIFQMIFRFLLRGIPKKSKAVELAAPPTLTGTARPHFPFCPRTTSSSLSSTSYLFFFLTTIIPENHHFCFFPAP